MSHRPSNDPLTRRILGHISDRRYQPRQLDALAEELGVEDDAYDAFCRAVQKLIDEDQVVLGSAQTLTLPPPGREMIGSFRLNARGFGFLVPDAPTEHGDLFVPAGSTGDALTGDRVRASVIHRPQRGGAGRDRSPFVGRVVEIIQRADKRYVGNLSKRGSHWVVEVDGHVLHDPVIIRDPHAKNAKAGDKVVIELIDYPEDGALAEGVITEVLGEQGEPQVETLAVMRAYGLKEKFPDAVVQEARDASGLIESETIPSNRENLTGTLILTIDPPDARDFDDAISIRRGGSGQVAKGPSGQGEEGSSQFAYELGVHIADVSHFVPKDGPLDTEARDRGNSAYLPRRVIPMLPEILSNGVCSLQEGVNRYCKSVFIRYDDQGRVLGARFARTVIRSAKRLTYLEAQALIDDDLRGARQHAKTDTKYSGEIVQALKLMDELAKVIRERRLEEGMIVLNLPEVELVFDDSGRVVDAQPEDDSFTHKLIEMFMVEANEAAARLFDSHDVPMIRRVHPDPPSHDLTDLRRFARVAGYNIPQHPSRKELQALLDSVRGKPQQHAVHLAVLQTLSKAEYAPLLIGHFALASEHYTHFTSPIRRYPDLVVHRGLDAYLDSDTAAAAQSKRKSKRSSFSDDPRLPDEQALQEIGRHCSTTERNAESAERELRYYFVLDLLSDHLGDDFDGTVTGVTGSGIYVQLDRFLVDGFIRISELPAAAGDQWRLNRTTGALVASRSGRAISIGDRFVVRIANVKPEARRLELVIIETRSTRPDSKRRQPKGARKAHEQTMTIKRQDKDQSKTKDRRGRRRRRP